MRKTIAVSLFLLFLVAIAVPVAAFEHEATYKWEGTIDFSQQAGHFCNTGAEMQQRITGQGSIVKEKSIYMEEGYIAVDDANDWVTAPNAIRNLTVTTAIMLCAPAKSTIDPNVDIIAAWYDDFEAYWVEERPTATTNILNNFPDLLTWAEQVSDPTTLNTPRTDIYYNGYLPFIANAAAWLDSNVGRVMTPDELYGELLAGDPFNAINPLTSQIWAVQVAANPGYSGQIDMTFEAANSNNWVTGKSDMDAYNGFWFAGDVYEDWPGYTEQKKGPWFPGSYFNIEQFSRTSQGTHRRYIDISSPWSHGYLNEEMTVTGMSEVWEAFSMENLTAGDEVGALWWDLF